MVWFQRGKHMFFNPSATGVGEAPFAILTDRILVALMKTSYSVDVAAHEQFNDINEDEIITTGYTPRGNLQEVTGKVVTRDDAGGRIYFDADDHTYTSALGASVQDTFNKIVILREQDSGATNANTELVAHAATGSVTTNGAPVTLVWNSQGIIQIS